MSSVYMLHAAGNLKLNVNDKIRISFLRFNDCKNKKNSFVSNSEDIFDHNKRNLCLPLIFLFAEITITWATFYIVIHATKMISLRTPSFLYQRLLHPYTTNTHSSKCFYFFGRSLYIVYRRMHLNVNHFRVDFMVLKPIQWCIRQVLCTLYASLFA